jgi:hypothetical protein
MSGHTPGPWTVLPLFGKYYGTLVSAKDWNIKVWARVRSDSRPSVREVAEGWEPDWGFDHVETEESYATAQLIAAAPEMYEALREVFEYLDAIPESAAGGDDDAVNLARKCRAVLDKAEGK